jgi:competence protein ComEA
MKSLPAVLLGILGGLALAGAIFVVVRLPAGRPITLEPAPTEQPIAVHVVGAVPRPGLYELPAGSRVQDAINAAGGLLVGVDVSALNLARRLQDGEQLAVGQPGANTAVSVEGSGAATAGGTVTAPTPAVPGNLVDINTASVAELDALPGIGPTAAQAILDYRDLHGPFTVIEELLNVPGIGPTTFNAIRALITV